VSCPAEVGLLAPDLVGPLKVTDPNLPIVFPEGRMGSPVHRNDGRISMLTPGLDDPIDDPVPMCLVTGVM
jgi:hypothetical protein